MNSTPNLLQPVENKVMSRVKSHGRGWVFTPRHFQNLGSSAAIESALRRLKAKGRIRRLTRGLYDFPKEDPALGTIAPTAEAIARALAHRDAIRLQPSGAYAANLLGLSEQVPSRVVFLTDGPARKVRIGKREIVLQHTTPRHMATAGRRSGLVIQALRHLGKDQTDERVIQILRRQLTSADLAMLRKDLIHAPAWIAAMLRPLTHPLTVL
ncbi:MAG: hypothetical protein H6678_03115 [Candidatus Delongbacteria bacterium]|nr:hypothetical protein [Candidatus Cloacimonadota bacterium]MCA9785164.1 hypothetical protein [Candidatus Cloacimonadota bacterium]MCB9472782.1 hypothetical protein [Candidatus Delongbacteria bacterium]